MRCFCILCAIVAAALTLLMVLAPSTAMAQSKPVSFINDVAPILKENCYACHDAKKRSGKLDMTSFEQFMAGGASDAPVAAGKPEKRIFTRAERAYGMLFLPAGQLVVAGGRPGQEGDVRVYDINGPAKTENGISILNGVNDPKVALKQLLDADDSILALAL